MAIKIRHEKANGLVAEYHRISQVTLRKINGEYFVKVIINSYLSKEVREKGTGLNLYATNHTITVPAEIVESGATIQYIYNELKKLPTFAEAEDC